jgi:peptide/nickel transport system permease protein
MQKPGPSDDALVVASPAGVVGVPATPAEPTVGLLRRRRRVGYWLAVGWLVAIVLGTVLAGVLPFVDDPEEVSAAIREGPSAEHWLGTDDIGRDVFARVLHGGRISLQVGVVTIALGMLIGGGLGLIAGYFRGRLERVIVAVLDVMLAYPALILLLGIVTFLGERSLRNVVIALTVISIPQLARIVRASTLTFSQREFVLAARALGARHRRILLREVLPNVIPPMLSFSLLAVAIVIVAEGALSFLGLSLDKPTWGNMINQGRGSLEFAPHISLMPAGVMFVTLLALNLVGDTLRARFDVREARL